MTQGRRRCRSSELGPGSAEPALGSCLLQSPEAADAVGEGRPVVDALRPHADERLLGAWAVGERVRLLRPWATSV
ncbi:MAG TPA: hypothetical protein VED63_02490 [Acidimicrobiales bacterium]|nr:hypothetical protein [Acidimicrobiales bacterium]